MTIPFQTAKSRIFDLAKDPNETRPFESSYMSQLFYRVIKDPDCKSALQTLRPDWFETSKGQADRRKREYLKRAQNGEARPAWKTDRAYYNYIKEWSGSYDKIFVEKIKTANPNWIE